MRAQFQEKWASMSATHKQQIVWAGAAVVFLMFGWYIFGDSTKAPPRRAASHARVPNELMPSGQARDLGLTGLAGDVKTLNTDQRKQAQDLDRLKKERDAEAAESRGSAEKDAAKKTSDELADLRREIEQLRNGQGVAPQPVSAPAGQVGQGGLAPLATRSGQAPAGAQYGSSGVGNRIIRASPTTIGTAAVDAPTPASPTPAAATIKEEAVPTQYLPSGSLLQGVIITGMDAPTGKQATKDPIPMLVRVKMNAILPNRYRADVRECFIVSSGHGDLASERAYIRSVSISCIRRDKRVIDIPVEMVAIGADGKAGVRGRLVSKQGQVIAKASLAGIAQGVAQAFSGSNVRLNLGADNVDYGAGLKSGAGEGVGSAFDRIAKYYLDMADQMFPVVEIDAGQKITFMLTKGAQMGVLK